MKTPGDLVAADSNWPIRLAEAFHCLRTATESEARLEARENLWTLLYFGLLRCLRAVAPRLGIPNYSDLEDIASTKSLEMLRRAESGAMDLSGKRAEEVVAFLSAAARNGLLDLKRSERRCPVVNCRAEGVPSLDGEVAWPPSQGTPSPSSHVEARDFARALRACVESMSIRSMRVWFFRVFFGLSSQEIADHPEVGLNAPHVDVLMQRARADLKTCMEGKGHPPTELPAGTFVELWEYFRSSGEGARMTARDGVTAIGSDRQGADPFLRVREDGRADGV